MCLRFVQLLGSRVRIYAGQTHVKDVEEKKAAVRVKQARLSKAGVGQSGSLWKSPDGGGGHKKQHEVRHKPFTL